MRKVLEKTHNPPPPPVQGVFASMVLSLGKSFHSFYMSCLVKCHLEHHPAILSRRDKMQGLGSSSRNLLTSFAVQSSRVLSSSSSVYGDAVLHLGGDTASLWHYSVSECCLNGDVRSNRERFLSPFLWISMDEIVNSKYMSLSQLTCMILYSDISTQVQIVA